MSDKKMTKTGAVDGRPGKGVLRLEIIGLGDDVLRLQKRLRNAGNALGVDIQLHTRYEKLSGQDRAAGAGPLVLADGALVSDGLQPLEALQDRLSVLIGGTHAGLMNNKLQ